jgi:hypothetical protein
VALAAVLPLLPTLRGGFVYDDTTLLLDVRPTLVQAFTWDLFGPDGDGAAASGYWRPLIRLSYLLESALFGARPALFHLDNVLLHAAVSLLLLAVLRAIPAFAAAALPAALLFAAHPVHAESLAVVTGRTDPLACLFFLLALRAALRGGTALPLAWLLAAQLSKESAAALAPVLAAAPFLRASGESAAARRRRAWTLAAGGLLIAGAFLLVKVRVLGIVPPAGAWTGAGTLLERGLTFVAALPVYAGLLLWPETLTIARPFALATGFGDPRVLAGLALLGGIALGCWKGTPPVRAGLAFFAWTLLPASNLVPITFAFEAMPFPLFERYLYVPSLGAALAAGGALLWLGVRLARDAPRAAAVAACLLAVPCGARLWQRSLDFESDATLYQADARHAPRPADLLAQAARHEYHVERDLDAAMRLFERALAADSQNVDARVERAVVELDQAALHRDHAAALRARGDAEAAASLDAGSERWLAAAEASLAPVKGDGARTLELAGAIAALRGDFAAARAAFESAAAAPSRTATLAGNVMHAARLAAAAGDDASARALTALAGTLERVARRE